MTRFLPWLATCLLCACGGDGSQAPPDDDPGGDPSAICLDSACGEAIRLLDIGGAENLLFTPEGRLFVSSGSGLFEIHKQGELQFTATLVAPPTCGGYLGLAQRGDYLYAVCGQTLQAGRLTAAPVMQEVWQIAGACIPNGMSQGPDGELYVVDEPLTCVNADPKIMRLRVSANDPLLIESQETWVQGSPLGLLFLGQNNVMRFPNGLQRRGNTFYGTDGGSIFSVEWQPDGTAGPVQIVFFEPTAHDDLGIAGQTLLVTDFVAGRVFQLSLGGTILQSTLPGSFTFPSSVRLGRPPMFEPTDVLITETGVLGDQSLPLDHLVLFRRR